MADTEFEPDLLLYAAEKLGSAVQTLATNPYDIRTRLRAASGDLARVPHAGLPSALREEFARIWTELTPYNQEEGAPKFSVRRRHLTTLSKIAGRLVSLEAKLAQYCQNR